MDFKKPHTSIVAASPIFLIGLMVSVGIFSFPPTASSQGSQTPTTGYAWSDTIGWISFDCQDDCGVVDYGIKINPEGELFGYAWSDNIGWISAEPSDVAGCPEGICTPRVESGELHGWMRALSPVGADESGHGGWDGWISLSGDNYGPTLQDGTFSGYAWGSDVVGWIQFSDAFGEWGVTTQYTECAPTFFCTENDQYYRDQYCAETFQQACDPLLCLDGACVSPPAGDGSITVTPRLVQLNDTAQVSWSTEDVESCSVSGGNGDSWSGTSGTETTSPIEGAVVYTLSCTGLDGNTFERSALVGTVPRFEEF